MRKLTWSLLLIVGVCIALSCAKDDNGEVTVAKIDREFAVAAAETNLMGIRTAELVKERASSPKVKEYGTAATNYYRIATRDLLALAQQKNISLPTALGVPNQQEYNRLAGLMGARFDSAYIDWAVRANRQAITALSDHSSATNDSGFKNWVDSRLATLEQIQQKALSIKEFLMNGTSDQ